MDNNPKPKSEREAEFLDKLRSLSISAAYELVSGFDRLKQLQEERTAGDAIEGDAAKNRSRMADLAFRFAKAELEHAETILNLSHTQADLLFEHARKLVRRTRSGGGPTTVVEMQKQADASFMARFGIRNPFDVDAYPRFELTKFRDQGGHEKLEQPAAECDPVRLFPRAHGDVVVSIAPGPLLAAGVYFAELSVFLSADVEMRVAHRLLRLHQDKAP